MTEEEWLACSRPREMMEYLMRDAVDTSERKGKLFLLACCQQAYAGGNAALERAVAVLGRAAEERQLTPEFETEAHVMAEFLESVYGPEFERIDSEFVGLDTGEDPHSATICSVRPELLCDLFRCIVGNPFRPVAFSDSWRTETAVALASGIYEDRAFDRLPILADALEEAGCDHPDVLTHCRGPGPHARGCWVVDGVLGKT